MDLSFITLFGRVCTLAPLLRILGVVGAGLFLAARFKEYMSKYALHMELAQKCMGIFNDRQLEAIGEMEQDMAMDVDSNGKPVRARYSIVVPPRYVAPRYNVAQTPTQSCGPMLEWAFGRSCDAFRAFVSAVLALNRWALRVPEQMPERGVSCR